MQAADDIVVREQRLILEPRVEIIGAREEIRQQKVEKRPQLVQIVLKRRAGEQKAILRFEKANLFGKLKIPIV